MLYITFSSLHLLSSVPSCSFSVPTSEVTSPSSSTLILQWPGMKWLALTKLLFFKMSLYHCVPGQVSPHSGPLAISLPIVVHSMRIWVPGDTVSLSFLPIYIWFFYLQKLFVKNQATLRSSGWIVLSVGDVLCVCGRTWIQRPSYAVISGPCSLILKLFDKIWELVNWLIS